MSKKGRYPDVDAARDVCKGDAFHMADYASKGNINCQIAYSVKEEANRKCGQDGGVFLYASKLYVHS
jgi:hypothetical protein